MTTDETTTTDPGPYMDTAELAQLTKAAPETVRAWRFAGVGPKWFRLPGTRRILYARADVERWFREARSGEAA